MFCEHAESCLFEKTEPENDGVGGLNTFWHCYSMISHTTYPITTYNRNNENSHLHNRETSYCSNFKVFCLPTRNQFFIFFLNTSRHQNHCAY